MLVRAATQEDAAAVAGLLGQLGYPSSAGEVAARLAARGGAAVLAFVAEADGRLAGVIVLNLIEPLHVEGRWAIVSALVVDEARRGTGVGAVLLAEAERFARAQGCTQVELSSNESRTRAHAFYRQQGFEEVRKRFVKKLTVGSARTD